MKKINNVKGNESQNHCFVPGNNSCGVFLFPFNVCFDKMWTDWCRDYRESILNTKTTSYQVSTLKKDKACLKQGDRHYSHNNNHYHLGYWRFFSAVPEPSVWKCSKGKNPPGKNRRLWTQTDIYGNTAVWSVN